MMSLVLLAMATVLPYAMGQSTATSGSASGSGSGSQMSTTSAPTSTQSGCPTVTLTSDICNTCMMPMCVELVPLTVSCGCPSAMPTVFTNHPCAKGCAGLGCQKNFAFFTATNCTDPSSASSTSGSGAGNATMTGHNSTSTLTTTGPVTFTSNGMTITSTPGATSTGPSSSSSSGAAMRLQPFWAVWL